MGDVDHVLTAVALHDDRLAGEGYLLAGEAQDLAKVADQEDALRSGHVNLVLWNWIHQEMSLANKA